MKHAKFVLKPFAWMALAGRGESHYIRPISVLIIDFRGFDSSIILIIRGGILMSIGDFPESLSQAILVGIMLVGRLGYVFVIVPPGMSRGWRKVGGLFTYTCTLCICISLSLYIYIHIHTYAYIHCVHTYDSDTYIYAYIYIYIHMNLSLSIYICRYVCTYIYIYIYIYWRVPCIRNALYKLLASARALAVNPHIHMYVYIYIYTYILYYTIL